MLVLAVCCLVIGQVTGPVSIQLTSPSAGQVVSNTITLTASASSTMGPIQRVEYYVDGVLVGTHVAFPDRPKNLSIVY